MIEEDCEHGLMALVFQIDRPLVTGTQGLKVKVYHGEEYFMLYHFSFLSNVVAFSQKRPQKKA